MIHEISRGIEEIQNRSPDDVNYEKLEVANRACTTLSKNVIMLEDQIEAGASVTENEKLLEEIRTITALFSDIIQDYVISEIESANITNQAIRRSTVKISILQIIIVLLSLFVSVTSYFYVSRSITNPIDDMQKLSAEIARGNFIARTPIPRVDEFEPLAIAMNRMTDRIDVLIKKNKEEQENFRKAEMKAPVEIEDGLHFESKFDTEQLLRVLVEKVLRPVGYDCSSVLLRYRERTQTQEQAADMESEQSADMTMTLL